MPDYTDPSLVCTCLQTLHVISSIRLKFITREFDFYMQHEDLFLVKEILFISKDHDISEPTGWEKLWHDHVNFFTRLGSLLTRFGMIT